MALVSQGWMLARARGSEAQVLGVAPEHLDGLGRAEAGMRRRTTEQKERGGEMLGRVEQARPALPLR